MTCRDLDRLRAERGGLPLSAWPEETLRHLNECVRCAALQEVLDGSGNQLDTETLDRRVEAALLPGLSSIKPLAPVSRIVAALLCSAAVVIALGNLGLGTAGWHARDVLQASVDFTLLAGGLVVLALIRANQMSPGAPPRSSSPVYVLAPAVILLAADAFLFGRIAKPDFYRISLSCWTIGLTCAALSTPVYFLILRRGVSLNPALSGATSGLFSGLTAVAILEIYCPYLDRAHISLAHVGAALTATLVGSAIGAVFSAPGGRVPGPKV